MANQLKQKQQAVILNSVTRLWKTGMMADIALQCRGGVISAHKSFLRAVSPYFDALISKTIPNESLKRIQFEHKVNAMKIVLDFLYSGEIPEELNEDLVSITEILATAHLMDLTLLFDHYWVMFNKLLSTSNFLLHLVTAEKYGQQNTVKEVIAFMVDNLRDITLEDSFNQLNKDQMEQFIKLAIEKIIPAEVVVSCILKWGQFNQAGRSHVVLKWMKCIGLSKLSEIYLQSLFQNGLVKYCDQLNTMLVIEVVSRLFIMDPATINEDNSTKTLHVHFTKITVENGLLRQGILTYDIQEKMWSNINTINFTQNLYPSLYMVLNSYGEPYYFARNVDGKIVAYDHSYNRSVFGCTFGKEPGPGISLKTTLCFLDDDIIAQYCTESEQWKTIRKPFNSVSNRCALMSCCAELFLYDYESCTLYKYGFNYDGWCIENVSPEPLTHVWSKCFSHSCRGRLFFANDCSQLTTYDTKTKVWKKYPTCNLVNASSIIANCDYLFVMFTKRDTLMFYNCESDITQCAPKGVCESLSVWDIRDYYLK